VTNALVVHIITQLELGGAQQNTLFTVSHLNRDLFEPILISGKPGILDDEARSLGIEFHQVPKMVREIRPHYDLAAAAALIKLLRKIKRRNKNLPVIIHTHSSKAGILGRWAAFLARCDIIVHTYHGFGFTDWQPFVVRNVFKWAERITRPITDAFICVSRTNIERGARERVLREKDTALIRSGIDINGFSSEGRDRVSIRSSIGVPVESPLVGMVACFKPQKAPVDFVEAAKLVLEKVNNVHFFIAGDGVLRREIEQKAKELDIMQHVHLLGWRRDVPDLIAALDVLVLTSLWEGLPRVIPQAMAAARPVVATAVDGSPEAVSDGKTGFLVKPRDIEDMASRIVEILNDPELGIRMGEEGRRLVAEFDIHKMVRDQEKLYHKLIETKLNSS